MSKLDPSQILTAAIAATGAALTTAVAMLPHNTDLYIAVCIALSGVTALGVALRATKDDNDQE